VTLNTKSLRTGTLVTLVTGAVAVAVVAVPGTAQALPDGHSGQWPTALRKASSRGQKVGQHVSFKNDPDASSSPGGSSSDSDFDSDHATFVNLRTRQRQSPREARLTARELETEQRVDLQVEPAPNGMVRVRLGDSEVSALVRDPRDARSYELAFRQIAQSQEWAALVEQARVAGRTLAYGAGITLMGTGYLLSIPALVVAAVTAPALATFFAGLYVWHKASEWTEPAGYPVTFAAPSNRVERGTPQ